ncbi:MAG: hypothetical protein EZS28_051547 [Streblomastix strix]|uniref:Uncharacterized protein n=1 Tax=Streblomastix strix TaxID=222440 RepID=A0A5J4T3B5_9EUKA|nr:MAG: hypothetical protein EZS28_051547 [Streblomastix strix]
MIKSQTNPRINRASHSALNLKSTASEDYLKILNEEEMDDQENSFLDVQRRIQNGDLINNPDLALKTIEKTAKSFFDSKPSHVFESDSVFSGINWKYEYQSIFRDLFCNTI